MNIKKTYSSISFFPDVEREIDVSDPDAREQFGGKGKNLIEMSNMGVPIPPGFVLSTEMCRQYHDNGMLQSMIDDIESNLTNLEKVSGKNFGSTENPLLVSVRSGAPISMPGMMDTVLNVGLNDHIVGALAKKTQNQAFAYDSYRRLIQMYGNVVLGLEIEHFEQILHDFDEYKNDVEVAKNVVDEYKKIVLQLSGKAFPQDVRTQLYFSIEAVFRSWDCERARLYRRKNSIPYDLYTAANIQSMVFGNMNNNSLTGVLFTRNPINGDKGLFGEFLCNAQGEDVVSGYYNTQPLTRADAERVGIETDISLETSMPEVFRQLQSIAVSLEKHYCDMQDIEFTVEDGKLWILQSRNGKRSANAAAQIAVDMVEENIISKKQALRNIDTSVLERILHPQLDTTHKGLSIARGLAASPGAATGAIALTPKSAENLAKKQNVILVRNETSPEDIAGMYAAQGIVTGRGGVTSHAAVVARGIGKPCVCGVSSMTIIDNTTLVIGQHKFSEGDIITINGTSGEIFVGEVPMTSSKSSTAFLKLCKWMDEYSVMSVLANAETENDVKTAIELGAEGIGLCRTEHMFFSNDRINDVRKMILASDSAERNKHLQKIIEYQKQDFKKLFHILQGKPICIRLLDPPLHEFLPHSNSDISDFCKVTGLDFGSIKHMVSSLHEYNPMLGHRGCRLAVTHPEIYEAQSIAIFSALAEIILNDQKSQHKVEIMVPLVMSIEELTIIKKIIETSKAKTALQYSVSDDKLGYKFGAMIELPRAALIADKIAELVDFMSFGTNDLTQTTLGMSRDDSGKFLHSYTEQGIINSDPFMTIDIEGVGALIKDAVQKACSVKKEVKIGVCGEHGGDPKSIEFFNEIGLDYVSCSPYRIPVAKLKIAQI